MVTSDHGGTGAVRSGPGQGEQTESRARAAAAVDPDQLAKDKRIEEPTVDLEVAWETRSECERVVEAAEVAAATAVERLLCERLGVADVVKLTGLDQATVR